VLIVDDDSTFREMLKTELRLGGFDVLEARDGIAALRLVDRHKPDAVILDLDLPACSGLNVREELLARPDTRNVPVIVVTGTDWSVPLPTAAVIRKSEAGQVMAALLQIVDQVV
jgi:DNA-binding response OmpR family regulator